MPTVKSSPSLRRAVGAILEQSTDEFLNTLQADESLHESVQELGETEDSITDSSSSSSNTSDIAAGIIFRICRILVS